MLWLTGFEACWLDECGIVWLVDRVMIGEVSSTVIGWGGFGYIICFVIKERSWSSSSAKTPLVSKSWANTPCVWKSWQGTLKKKWNVIRNKGEPWFEI